MSPSNTKTEYIVTTVLSRLNSLNWGLKAAVLLEYAANTRAIPYSIFNPASFHDQAFIVITKTLALKYVCPEIVWCMLPFGEKCEENSIQLL